MSRAASMSQSVDNKYGLRYFDKTPTESEDEYEDDEDEYEERSCSANCCDIDCECDDCQRCSDMGLKDAESYEISVSAA